MQICGHSVDSLDFEVAVVNLVEIKLTLFNGHFTHSGCLLSH